MQKVYKIIFVLSLITNIILGFTLCSKPKDLTFDTSEYTTVIDSLEEEISKIIDERSSIEVRIDTVFIRLDSINKDYEKVRNNIMFNSTSEDYLFFIRYLESSRIRYDSINNPKAAKGN